MNRRFLLGVMVSRRGSRKKMLNLYKRYNNLGLKLCSFTPADVKWRKKRATLIYRKNGKWKTKVLPLPRVIYNQCYTLQRDTTLRLERLIGKNRCFNRVNQLNKWDIYNILADSTLNTCLPKTILYSDFDQLAHNNLLFLKPSLGYQGRGIYRIEKQEDGSTNISQNCIAPSYICRKYEELKQKLDQLVLKETGYIIQEGISFLQIDNRFFDIRVLVQKGRHGKWGVSNIISRIAYEGYFNTSISESIRKVETVLQPVFSPWEINHLLNSLNFLSTEAAKTIDVKIGSMAELSVDFGIDTNGNPWLIEVNGDPQKRIYKQIPGLENRDLVYKRPLQYAYHLFKRR